MRSIVALLAAVALMRCATAAHSELQRVPVTSTPAGAEVTLDCGRGATRVGTTPMTLMMRRRDSRCMLFIVKNGWRGTRVDFHRVPSIAALGNVIPALLAGGIAASSNVDFSATNGSTQGGGVVNVSASGSGSVSPAAVAGVVLSGALLIAAGSGALFAQSPSRGDVTLEPKRFDLIDVGESRRLHIVCQGTGSPTVVLESGAGEGWYTWALVQPVLARSYRTCSYDRAGIGFSDSRSGRSVSALNDDLHELLRHGGERPPFVLVGHSLGGLLVRRFAARYPGEVAGIVLVDSVHEDFDRGFPPLPEEQEKVRAAREAGRRQIAEWETTGKWPEMDFHERLPRELINLLKPRSASAAWWQARFAEGELPDSNTPPGLTCGRADLPLTVITASKWTRPPWRTEERQAAWLRARAEMQNDLASCSARSRHITVDTEHHVQLERPTVVVDAIVGVARRATSRPLQ